MKEYRVVDEDRYDTFEYLADLLTELAKYGWEVKCTLGVRGQVVLLEREIPPSPNATRASDNLST